MLSEPGLYTFVLQSNKPEATLFIQWIYNRVIPQIRKRIKRLISIQPQPSVSVSSSLLNQQSLYSSQKHPSYLSIDNNVDYTATTDCYVYVATNDDLKMKHIYKIGVTNSIERIATQLNTSSAYKFFFIFVMQTRYEIGKRLSSHFILNRFHNDFYILNASEVESIPDICKLYNMNSSVKSTSSCFLFSSPCESPRTSSLNSILSVGEPHTSLSNDSWQPLTVTSQHKSTQT